MMNYPNGGGGAGEGRGRTHVNHGPTVPGLGVSGQGAGGLVPSHFRTR